MVVALKLHFHIKILSPVKLHFLFLYHALNGILFHNGVGLSGTAS